MSEGQDDRQVAMRDHSASSNISEQRVTPNRRHEPVRSASTPQRRQSRRRRQGLSVIVMISVWLQLVTNDGTKAFTMIPAIHSSVRSPSSYRKLVLHATGGGGSKKKRRKRKPTKDPLAKDPASSVKDDPSVAISIDQVDEDEEPVDISMINEVANFRFEPKKDEATRTTKEVTSSSGNRGSAIPLPDIKEARKKKELEEELTRKEEEEEANKVRIKRSDTDAFRKLLEQQPFADADDSLFEEEEYGAVSALLGERAKPFLGIPLGPLQVGHFIGALGIILMAFVEYPGFPLTNLPTPLRSCLQGGLTTIFAINAVLAGLVAFKAPERGQPVALWIPKTFAVGGLAYDQLMQLPTLEEVEKAKAVKGRRSLKNKKK